MIKLKNTPLFTYSSDFQFQKKKMEKSTYISRFVITFSDCFHLVIIASSAGSWM